jgi:large subunit ribosomal protein L35
LCARVRDTSRMGENSRTRRTGRTAAAVSNPKMKTHSGASKRFRLTGSGKVMRRRAMRNHKFAGKPSKRTRRLWNEVVVADADAKKIKKLLGK